MRNGRTSLAEAKARFARLFPGVYGSYRDDGSEVQYTNGFDADFFTCANCDNVTLRLWQESRRVMSHGEVELVEEEGFAFWSERTAVGNMAAPASQLSFLGRTDPERPTGN